MLEQVVSYGTLTSSTEYVLNLSSVIKVQLPHMNLLHYWVHGTLCTYQDPYRSITKIDAKKHKNFSDNDEAGR